MDFDFVGKKCSRCGADATEIVANLAETKYYCEECLDVISPGRIKP